MEQKVYLKQKKLHPQRKGIPSSFKIVKLHQDTYFRLLELEEALKLSLKRQGRRASKNACVSFLLDFYEKNRREKE